MSRGEYIDPCTSVKEAIRMLRGMMYGEVYVTKKVFDSFDWKDHINVAKVCHSTLVNSMDDVEKIACIRVIGKGEIFWYTGHGKKIIDGDRGWEACGWVLRWDHATKKQIEWILKMAVNGLDAKKKEKRNGKERE